MNIWDKFKKSKTDPVQSEQNVVEQLERLRFEARPEFQQNLKTSLLASLYQEQAAPVSKPARWGAFGPGWKPTALVGLGISASVLVAILILIAAVLSVPASTAENPTVIALNASASAGPTLADTPEASSDALQLYSLTARSYINQDEAQKVLGFPVRIPTYLPTGYKLETANLQVPPEKSGPEGPTPIKGYQLRYSATGQEKRFDIEVSEWRVPFTFKLGSDTAGQTAPNLPPVRVLGVQRFTPQTIQGVPGYLIQVNPPPPAAPPPQGGNGVQPPAGRPLSSPPAPPGRPTSYRANPPVFFGRSGPNRPDFFVGFNQPGEARNYKTLLWQQNGILSAVSSGDPLTVEELRKVAESLSVAP